MNILKKQNGETEVKLKMDGKTVVILILIGYLVFFYNSPDKAKGYIEQGVGKVKGLIVNKTSACDATYDPVCSGGVTYNNLCLAEKEGMTNVTFGVC